MRPALLLLPRGLLLPLLLSPDLSRADPVGARLSPRCSLAGTLDASGRCACLEGWTGAQCSKLDLEPVASLEEIKAWAPHVDSVNNRAEAFRRRLVATEPVHVEAVVEFADRAWRRPLSDSEKQGLRGLYQQLRESGIPHEEATRLTIARVMTSPAFLYRKEQPAPGDKAAPVAGLELANRLSYFLWSSMPDAELRGMALAGTLTGDQALIKQTQRMLDDPRIRRLAIQFACQWLHLRNFDQNDDKNEKLYPEFRKLRGEMYEETVRFFEDMFRRDGSILDLLDADQEELDWMISVNCTGPHQLTQAVARWMIEERAEDSDRSLSIIFVTSISAESATPNRGGYCMAKAASSMSARLFAVRLAEHSIPVYEVRPGIIATDMTAPVKDKYDAFIADGNLLDARWGTPEDIGKATAALVRGDLPYATGAILTIDGELLVAVQGLPPELADGVRRTQGIPRRDNLLVRLFGDFLSCPVAEERNRIAELAPGAPKDQRHAMRHLLALMTAKTERIRLLRRDQRYRTLLSVWLLIHIPATSMAAGLVFLHVLTTLYFW